MRTIVLTLLLALLPTSALAAEQQLVPVGNDSSLSAYGGWVVWSEQGADGRWALTAFHDGMKLALPVATRSAPFDADVGPGAGGQPVIVYSRCATDPAVPGGFAEPNALPQWNLASGCRLHRYDPATGTETALDEPGAAGHSDTTPSQWHGRIAFARATLGASVMRLYVWTPGARTPLRRLRGGAVPRRCTLQGGCANSVFRGEVQQLDLGARVAGFLWEVEAPAVEGTGTGWEMRADLLRGRAAGVRIGKGYNSGACGGEHPVSPNADGVAVWFVDIRISCDVPHSIISLGSTATGLTRKLEVGPPVAWQLARDGNMTYSIRGPRPSSATDDPPCVGSGAPCELVLDDAITLPHNGRRSSSPF